MPRTASATRDDRPYVQRIAEEHARGGMWDYLAYDGAGDLWINGLRVADAVRRYGAPLEIVDTTIIERRCAEWQRLAEEAAREVGYPGRLRYLYAAKANMASEVAHAAYRSGWGAETSSRQDLSHLQWLRRHRLVPGSLRVVCNGFKLPDECYSLPEASPPEPAGDVYLPPDTLSRRLRATTYARAILSMARAGWDITPILDEGELAQFLRLRRSRLDVGLRLKLGRVGTPTELGALVSRFGLQADRAAEAADEIARSKQLRLTTLHTMVGAASAIPVDEFVEGLLLGARVWAELRQRHATLTEINMGGGVPPLGDPYEHRGFLIAYFQGLAAVARVESLPPPDVTFEFGSLVAAESAFHVFRVLQLKSNHTPSNDGIDRWAIVDGGLMAAIPDMLIIDKAFAVLAVDHGLQPAETLRLGDVTCDSDGRYPPAAFGPHASVLLPRAGGPQHVLIQGVGAYQEILAGVRGAHHCGLLEAAELVLERGRDGQVRGRLMPRQTSSEAAALLGYTTHAAPSLRRTLGDG